MQSMDTKSDNPWKDTPEISARIVTAIGRIALSLIHI